MTTTPAWTDAADLTDLWDGAGMPVQAGGRTVALFRVGETVYANDGVCTHGDASLCDGFVDGHEIECPLHQGRFDLRTGAATCAPAVDGIKTYPVRIEGGRVFVALG